MEFIASLFPGIAPVFVTFWWIFTHGGWALFILLIARMLYLLYKDEIQTQFKNALEWDFLMLKVPRENISTLLSVEQIFSQIHVIQESPTFAEAYIEGYIQPWFSFEIISMGGKISFLIRVPRKKRDLVEAAIYAQYPDAEITEVADYLENFNFHPGHGDIDIWGTEFKLTDDYTLPIRTYKDFEDPNHPVPEEKVVDPMGGLFEGLTQLKPYEFFGLQILARPVPDDAWHSRGEKKVKELVGEEVHEKSSLAASILFLPFTLLKMIGSRGGHGGGEEKKEQKNNWLSMTEVEKERVNLLQRKMSKSGYNVKIRALYIAPIDKFDKQKRNIAIGPFRTLAHSMSNKLKPDVSHTWTNVNYKISPALEKPWLDYQIRTRKHHLFDGFKRRSFTVGGPAFVLNTEELATLFHLPITTDTTPGVVEKLEAKKAQPPINLPVGEY